MKKPIHDHKGAKNPMFGRHHSEETKEKIRQNHLKKGLLPPLQNGYRHTEETKKRIKDALIGNTYSKGKKWSKEARLRITKNKEHITDTWGKWRGSVEYREWREAVFKRDDWTCQDCGEMGGRLCADHIKKWAEYPELRLELSNGRTLCELCHKSTANYGNRHQRKYEYV